MPLGSGRTPSAAAGFFLLGYGVLPNLAFALASHWLYLERPLLNLDYLVIGSLFLRFGRRVVGGLVAVALANDLVSNAAPACHFALPEFLRALRNLDLLDPRLLVLAGVALIVLCSLGALAMVKVGGGAPHPVVVTAFAVVGIAVAAEQLARDHNPCKPECSAEFICHEGACFQPEDVPVGKVNLALVTTLKALGEETDSPPAPRRAPKPDAALASPEVQPQFPSASPESIAPPGGAPETKPESHGSHPVRDSATAELLALARDPTATLPQHDVALVVVESLGQFIDPETNAALLLPLTQLSQRYTVEVGSVPFHGSTWHGELRELCGAQFKPPIGGMPKESKRTYPECLPALLAKRGYHTVALHGFDREMYNRSSWYPNIGFQEMLFREELAVDGLQLNCGIMWRGTCDPVAAHRFLQELRAGTPAAPRFAYWMTLNSHLPDAASKAERPVFDCTLHHPTAEDWIVCRHAWALSVVLETIAEVASDPALPPTDFIIVGDHAPPFPVLSQREAFERKLVPYVTLSWRGP